VGERRRRITAAVVRVESESSVGGFAFTRGSLGQVVQLETLIEEAGSGLEHREGS
jgi:hypothetical protein